MIRRFISGNKILIENIYSLGALQFINYFFPFITFPYLVRVVGIEKFGLVNFASAFVGYFILITDYGFNISAVRNISIQRNEKERLQRTISSIFIIKLILFFLSLLLFLSLVLMIKIFYNEIDLYLITFLIVLGNLLTPNWFFQGVEKTKYITIITLITKSIWTLSIFLLIKNKDDYILWAILNSIQVFLTGIILFIIMLTKYDIKFILPQIEEIKYQLKDGGLIFLSTCSISVYTISNTFILGLFTSNTNVGYFVGADKIRQAFQNLIYPFTQSMYAHVSKLFSESIEKGKKFILNSAKTIGILSFLISLLCFIFAEELVLILLGKEYLQSIIILRIISFLPFIIYLSNLFGIQTMLNFSYNKQFTIIISIAAIISLTLSLLLVPKYFEIGTAITSLITEIFVTGAIIFFLLSKGFFSEKPL